MPPACCSCFIRFLILLLGILSTGLRGHAQPATNLPPYWHWQNPLPQGFDLLDLHVFNDSTALAVGNGGTVVKTTDYGRNWQVGTAGTIAPLTAVSFGSGLVGWAGHYNQPAAVRKTLDGGNTWTLQPLGLADAATINDIQCLSPLEAYVLYRVGATGSTELRHTVDGGQTWTLQSRLLSGDPLSMQFVSPTVGFVTGGAFGLLLLQKTTDGGLTWQRVTPDAAQPQGYNSLSFVTPRYGWVGRSGNKIYRTRNGGQTWQAQQLPGTAGRVVFADTLHGVCFGPVLYLTSNGGQTWTTTLAPDVYTLTDIRLQASGAGWLVGQRGEWWRTQDYGAHWLRADSLPAGVAQQAQFPDPTHAWVIKSRTTLARSADRGSSWQPVDLSTKTTGSPLDWNQAFVQALHFVDRDTGFVAVLDYGPGSIPRLFSLATQNGGQTWAVTQQPAIATTNASIPFPLVQALKFQSARRGLVAGGQGLLRRTTDGGLTWTSPVVPPAVSRRRTLSAIAWVSAQTVYVVGDSLTLLKSTDGGASFQAMPGLAAFKAGLPQPRTWNTISNLTFASPLVGLIGFGDEIVRTADGGQTWAFAAVPPDQSVTRNSFYGFSFSTPREGWALSYDNVAATTDGGQTWTRTAIFSPPSYAVNNSGTRIDRYNGWVYSGFGNLMHYSEKFLLTAPLTQTSYCAGDSVDVAFQREGTFSSVEQAVRVELSNARGRFRPGETTLLKLGTASPLRVGLPAGLPTSASYRIRVIRADSSVLGSDNGQDLRVTARTTASITPTGPMLSVCQGSTVQLAAPTGLAQYLWSTGATTRTLTVGAAGTYSVQVATAAGCLGPPSAAVTVAVVPLPAQPVVQQLPSGQLAVSAPVAGATYQWLVGGSPLPGATQPTYPATGPAPAGTYTVVATAGGCPSPPSAPLAVVLATRLASPTELRLYPNPAHTLVYLERVPAIGPTSVTVLDALGKPQWQGDWRTGQLRIPVQDLAPGLYLVRVQPTDGPALLQRFVVAH